MVVRKLLQALTASAIAALVAACGSVPAPRPDVSSAPTVPSGRTSSNFFILADPEHSREMVIFALGLIDTGYRFGGRNPDAGLDCSGMVSYVVEQVSGYRLPHNAAQIADRTRPVSLAMLQPGDLVFFNTMNRPYSHMGIYMGEGKFVHAPSSRGRVRVERLDSPYFRSRFDGARTLLADG
ncbi:C40 family peptidase [Aromatoleum toluolicum]|uniref:NlpC/P60 domain-containing protein n=1 Tax=Aromatoleum toluolicum TaxID=90060 RepID=A0ABX1NDW8_9RHOO|nr:C40 family peptidase [Aromatoleum toluolicum]NMF97403.1 C40 family peptidase [Aromatoleum toluolicum]